MIFPDTPRKRTFFTSTLGVGSGGPAPSTVWVWAYFINPDVNTNGSWSDAAIRIDKPFQFGDTATVRAVGGFHWATNTDLPRKGYYDWISVSAVSAEDARIPADERNYRSQGALPVISR